MRFAARCAAVPSITDRIKRAAEQISERDAWSLAAVPLVAALLRTSQIRDVITYDGVHLGITLGLPLPVSTVWKFVSMPANGVEVTGPSGTTGAVVFAVGLLVQGVLAAGYLGSLRDRLAGEDADFLASVRRYVVPFVGFGILLVAMYVPPLLFAAFEGPSVALLAWFPILFLAAYLIYAAPFLIVLDDDGLVAALARSATLATSEGAYLRYAAGYAGLVAVVSLPATVLTVNLGPAGVLLGAAVLAPLALVFDAATLQFVDDVTDGDAQISDEDGTSHGPDAAGDRGPETGTDRDAGWGSDREWGADGADADGGLGPDRDGGHTP